jgi:hypothetical protein
MSNALRRLRHKQQKSVQVVAGWLTHQVQDGGSPMMAPSPLQSTTFSTLNVMGGKVNPKTRCCSDPVWLPMPGCTVMLHATVAILACCIQPAPCPLRPAVAPFGDCCPCSGVPGAEDYYGEDADEEQQQYEYEQQQQVQYMTGGMVSSRAGWTPHSTLPRSTGGGRQMSAIPGYMAEEDPMQQTGEGGR